MEFTVISVVGTLLIGWVIGRKFLKVDRDTSYPVSYTHLDVYKRQAYTQPVKQENVSDTLRQQVSLLARRGVKFVPASIEKMCIRDRPYGGQ